MDGHVANIEGFSGAMSNNVQQLGQQYNTLTSQDEQSVTIRLFEK